MTSSFGRSRRRLSRLLGSKKQLSLSGAALVALVAGVGVFGYWTTGGSGSASAGSGTLTAASISAPSTSSGSVTVSWDTQAAMTPASQSPNITYTVEREFNGGGFVAIVTGGCSGSFVYNTASCTDPVGASGTYKYRVVAHFLSAWTAVSNEVTVTATLDSTPPTVLSINRQLGAQNPTNAATVQWTVTFSEDVTGVGAGDFTLVGSGSTGGAAITDVSGGGATYTVTADTGDDGVLGLNLVDDDSIEDLASNPLGGTGAGNGNFTGATYVVDRTAPEVDSITRDDANPTNAAIIAWTVTFDEDVENVDPSDFALTTSGLSGTPPAVGTVTPIDDATYTVTASTGTGTPSGSGTIRLDVVDDDSIEDGIGNKLGGTGTANGNFTSGETYTIDKTQPTVSSINRTGTNPTNVGPLTWGVTFSEPVNNVTTGNFSATTSNTGGSAPTVTSATAVGGAPATVWNVSVSTAGTTGANNGSIRLDLSSVGSIRDVATNLLAGTFNGEAYTYDTTQPTVTGVSSTLANDSYKASQVVPVTVTFSEVVSVTGTPRLTLATGTPPTTAVDYSSGSDTNTLTFNYTVAAGNTSPDLDYVGTGSLTLNGGTIRDAVTNYATLTLAAPGAAGSLGANKNIVIDTTTPAISSVTVSSGTTSGQVSQEDTITIVFSEAIKQSTICNAWTDDTTNRTSNANANRARLTDGGSGADTLTVTVISGCTSFNFGQLSLGSNGYITNNNGTSFFDFGGNPSTDRTEVSYTVATRTLVITLGVRTGSATAGSVAAGSSGTYTPNAGVSDIAGNAGIAAVAATINF